MSICMFTGERSGQSVEGRCRQGFSEPLERSVRAGKFARGCLISNGASANCLRLIIDERDLVVVVVVAGLRLLERK
jgi:hypothetical protein